MDSLLENVLIGLCTGVVTGLVSGYYAGIVLSRVTRFFGLMREAQRALKRVECSEEGEPVEHRGWDSLALGNIADDLEADQQIAAADVVRSRSREVTRATYAALEESNVRKITTAIAEARKEIGRLRPSLHVLLPWGAL